MQGAGRASWSRRRSRGRRPGPLRAKTNRTRSARRQCEGHLAVRRATSPISAGPASAGFEADQGGQAHRARGCVLARRREERADPDLRHGLLHQDDLARTSPGRGGAGETTVCSGAARSLPPRGQRPAPLLAPEGDGDLEHPRGPPPPREREARLLEVKTPLIYDKGFETSGHWEKFREHISRSPTATGSTRSSR